MIKILCGKSASGKDLIRKKLEKLGYKNVVSYTTRPMRNHERNGYDYHFVPHDYFMDMINKGKFIEYRTYNTLLDGKVDTWYYGLGKQQFNDNENYVIVLDLKGISDFMKFFKNSEQVDIIYVECGDEERTKRAKNRQSYCETEWNRRLEDDNNVFMSLPNYIRIVGNEKRTIKDVVKDVIKNV